MQPQTAPRRHPYERQRRPLTFLALGSIAAALAAAAVVATAARAPASSALSFRISHYLCYSAKTPQPFEKREVVVVDQFKEERKTVVVGVDALCNPASKNRSPIIDKRAHLACYRTTSAQPFKARRVAVVNQFGTTKLAVVKPSSLCLPSAKSLGPTTAPLPVPKSISHFQCYPVKALSPTRARKVTVVDQFGRGTYTVTTPIRLCNPASKDGSQIVDSRDHLVCYLAKPAVATRTRKAFVFNQFGTLQVVASAPTRLCLPSLKRELS